MWPSTLKAATPVGAATRTLCSLRQCMSMTCLYRLYLRLSYGEVWSDYPLDGPSQGCMRQVVSLGDVMDQLL